MKPITYILGHYEMARPGYHWATETLERVAADRASEMDEDPSWKRDGVPFGPADIPPPYVAPGEIGLTDAVRSFCARVSGLPHERLTGPEVAHLAQPVRDLLVKGRVKVTCIPHGSPPRDVHEAAFRDDGTWFATLWDQSQLPIRPEFGLVPGFLVLDRKAFEEGISSDLGLVDATAFPVDTAKIVAPNDRLAVAFAFARELQERFDLWLDYPFNREAALSLAKQLLAEQGRGYQFSDNIIRVLITLIGNPKWDRRPPPPDEEGRRSQNPEKPFAGVVYPRGRSS